MLRMWWVSFVTGCIVGAVLGILLLALAIAGAEEKHGKR